MKRRLESPWLWALAGIVVVGISAPWLSSHGRSGPWDVNAWQAMTSPGPLTQAHAKLEQDCSACHTPIAGATDDKCVQCHANSSTILIMQPTTFHQEIGNCRVCHREHQGRQAAISEMDHKFLAAIVERRLRSEARAGDQEAAMRQRHLAAWAGESTLGDTQESAETIEMALDCNQCHSLEDPHVGYFGTTCAACHVTEHWKIASYVHPSDLSTDCEQCHRPPLSHSSPMFASMCATMLGKAGSPVSDCHACHRITSWFDIRGAPWHKQSMGHGYGR